MACRDRVLIDVGREDVCMARVMLLCVFLMIFLSVPVFSASFSLLFGTTSDYSLVRADDDLYAVLIRSELNYGRSLLLSMGLSAGMNYNKKIGFAFAPEASLGWRVKMFTIFSGVSLDMMEKELRTFLGSSIRFPSLINLRISTGISLPFKIGKGFSVSYPTFLLRLEISPISLNF